MHLCNEKKLKVRILRPYQIHNKSNQTCIMFDLLLIQPDDFDNDDKTVAS